jgi:hypothetical protein
VIEIFFWLFVAFIFLPFYLIMRNYRVFEFRQRMIDFMFSRFDLSEGDEWFKRQPGFYHMVLIFWKPLASMLTDEPLSKEFLNALSK